MSATSTLRATASILTSLSRCSHLGHVRQCSEVVAPCEAFYAGLGDQKIVTTLCPGGKERMRRLMEMIAQRRAFELFSHQRDGVLKVALYPNVAALGRAEMSAHASHPV